MHFAFNGNYKIMHFLCPLSDSIRWFMVTSVCSLLLQQLPLLLTSSSSTPTSPQRQSHHNCLPKSSSSQFESIEKHLYDFLACSDYDSLDFIEFRMNYKRIGYVFELNVARQANCVKFYSLYTNIYMHIPTSYAPTSTQWAWRRAKKKSP